MKLGNGWDREPGVQHFGQPAGQNVSWHICMKSGPHWIWAAPQVLVLCVARSDHFIVRSEVNTVPFVSGLTMSAATTTTAPRMVP